MRTILVEICKKKKFIRHNLCQIYIFRKLCHLLDGYNNHESATVVKGIIIPLLDLLWCDLVLTLRHVPLWLWIVSSYNLRAA